MLAPFLEDSVDFGTDASRILTPFSRCTAVGLSPYAVLTIVEDEIVASEAETLATGGPARLSASKLLMCCNQFFGNAVWMPSSSFS